METPRLPVEGEYVRGCGRLVDIQTAPPPPPPVPDKEYIFAERTASVVVFLKDGTPMKRLSTLNEFYGEGTATHAAIEQANIYATNHKITPESDVILIVVEKTEHVRMRRSPAADKNYMAAEFVSFQTLNIGSKRDVPADIRKIVWSSSPEALCKVNFIERLGHE
jgi:hypothetical protein